MRRLTDLLLPALALPGIAARAAEFVYRRGDSEGDIHPGDAADGIVEGPDPDRIVVIGESGMISLGVRTHGISLTACLARHHASRTGRGVVWSSTLLPGSRIRDASAAIEGLACDLERADAVVLLVGITDALRVTSVSAWQLHLSSTLAELRTHLARDAWILVAEIPPLDNAGSLSRPARMAAGLHSRALNRGSRDVVVDARNACTVGFPEELTRSLWLPESEETRYRDTYRVWGAHLARALADVRAEID